MVDRPVAARSANGVRLHLQHGPIDLIISADGPVDAREWAFAAAEVALGPVLADLVEELSALRSPSASAPVVHGPVASRMVAATAPYGDRFITPMAAVAGAVADHVLAAASHVDLDRLTVNNGGDIAFDLRRGASIAIGLVVSPAVGRLEGTIAVPEESAVRGVATSGWRGRSFSLGVADAVTVLARDAASADAAATAIASAVDLPGHPAIARVPARRLDESSDLGDRLVTRAVGPLDAAEREAALAPGLSLADELLAGGVIEAALLVVGETWASLQRGASPFALVARSEGADAGPPTLTPLGGRV